MQIRRRRRCKTAASGCSARSSIAWAIWLGLKFISWARTYFVVTDQRVIYRTGVVVAARRARSRSTASTTSTSTRASGSGSSAPGDLEIQSAGEQGTTLFEYVRHPDGVQQEIYRQMEATRDATPGPAPTPSARRSRKRSPPAAAGAPAAPAAGADVPEQIEQLARLRDQGHITPEEYERRRRSCSSGCSRSGAVDRFDGERLDRAATACRAPESPRAALRRRRSGRRHGCAARAPPTQPPNPAPVRRAPSAPASTKASTSTSSSGRRHLEVVAEARVARRASSGPSASTSPRAERGRELERRARSR